MGITMHGVTDNVEASRFELRDGDEVISVATYRVEGDDVIVPHVETAIAHRGNGNADRLMFGLMAILNERGQTITPLCPFAVDYLATNPANDDNGPVTRV